MPTTTDFSKYLKHLPNPVMDRADQAAADETDGSIDRGFFSGSLVQEPMVVATRAVHSASGGQVYEIPVAVLAKACDMSADDLEGDQGTAPPMAVHDGGLPATALPELVGLTSLLPEDIEATRVLDLSALVDRAGSTVPQASGPAMSAIDTTLAFHHPVAEANEFLPNKPSSVTGRHRKPEVFPPSE
jgi:hypothetical protein